MAVCVTLPAPAPRVVVTSGEKFHAYHLARGAHAAGWLHRFVTTIFDRREQGVPPDKVVEISLPAYAAKVIARLPLRRRQALSYLMGDALFDRAASRHLDGADIVHGFNNHSLATIRRARAAGCVTIVERAAAHPSVQHQVLRDEFARFGLTSPTGDRRLHDRQVREYQEADWIMVPSDFVHRTMIAGGVPAGKLRRLPLGVSIERFGPGPKHDDRFRVLYVGALTIQKGLPYLLDAFRLAALPPERSELVLVGEEFPDASAFLPRYAGLYRRVRFVAQHDLAREYQQASVFVLPSLQDGFGMVVYEAAACGLPVIVSDHVGAEIRDGRDGFVVPIRDAAAIADKLVFLYGHERERRRMGESAMELARQCSWERYHAGLLAHYRDILAARA